MRQKRLACLLVVAATAAGCAPRFGYVKFEQLAVAASKSPTPNARLLELGSRSDELARSHGLNLVFNYSAVVYAAPDLDLTPMVLGQPGGTFRVGVRGGVVDLQRALNTTREGQQAKARLQRELEQKQGELNRMQRELRDKYGGDQAKADAPERLALLERLDRFRHELAALEQAEVKRIVERLTAEAQELARARRIDLVVEANALGKDLVYRRWGRYPIDKPDLTGELIRLHDERSATSPPKTLPE